MWKVVRAIDNGLKKVGKVKREMWESRKIKEKKLESCGEKKKMRSSGGKKGWRERKKRGVEGKFGEKLVEKVKLVCN